MNPCASLLVVLLGSCCSAAAHDLSLQQLVAQAQNYDGKRVSVTGYYVSANEESCLYATREVAKKIWRDPRADLQQVLWIDFHGIRDARPAVNRYVRFVGTFHHKKRFTDEMMREGRGYGQFNMFPSKLDVTSFTILR